TETPTVTTFTPSFGLTPGGTYSWRVRSLYATLPASSFSPVFVFTVNPGAAPIQPILGGPTDNLVVPTSEPTLAWKVNAQPNASMTYELELADNENMQNSNVISDITTTYQAVSGLHNDKNYYWRVRSKNADGSYSEYSGMGKFYAKFSVTAVDNELVIPQKFTLEQNYPNPFNPTTTIRFALPEASFVILRIYNMLGQEVKTLVNGEKNAGTYNVQWRGDNNFGVKVSSGTYIYRVIAGQNIFTKKMVLLK
ncbi:MAG: T9SS type A sorting domain-containing protein, partial [Bacteroidetes bacterium]|nr:T9SS type A sorting domain-containing protein [Bacteroidota bacterium]